MIYILSRGSSTHRIGFWNMQRRRREDDGIKKDSQRPGEGPLGIISVTRLGDLSLILVTHMFDGTNSLTQVVLWPPSTCPGNPASFQINKCKKSKKDTKKPRDEYGHQKKRETTNTLLLKPPQRASVLLLPRFWLCRADFIYLTSKAVRE